MTTHKIIYGTAWKESRTTALVVSAVLSGFRAIDTACQPKHYREDLVGEALQVLYDKHGFKREDFFLQTKYTSISGQDRKKPLPYDPTTDIGTQVRASVQKSLENLKTTYLDSLLLHSPLDDAPYPKTILAWKTLMVLQEEKTVRHIGVSNTYDVATLDALHRGGGKMVEVVQNRWYQGNNWDPEVLNYCVANRIQYQSFWTLTGSPKLLSHPVVTATIAKGLQCTPEQAVYRIAQSRGVTPISGTTSEEHMKEDLAVDSLVLYDKFSEDADVLMSSISK
ncbi:hypothetical protein EIP91_002778 [Steccherinum ochraceum]|uniref:NADP-dependent oxidoreductase domain-containing protein n=1 Tax=Steccherinum ochraceum TaxID=92696 RepID=A0A4R0RBF5_9APHY|nr:hypothetical protein EIP91_002778 [Steccherinum ochraceum]